MSADVGVSQPVLGIRSQLPNPVLQVNPHTPVVQVRLAFGRVAQLVPQAPQFATSLAVGVSQPLVSEVSQSPKPALQLTPQVPAAHAGPAFGRAGHGVAQAPQLAMSSARCASQPFAAFVSQSVKPELQV